MQSVLWNRVVGHAYYFLSDSLFLHVASIPSLHSTVNEILCWIPARLEICKLWKATDIGGQCVITTLSYTISL